MDKCKYFRCHDLEEEDFDCSLCYCPFYEICKDEKKYNLFGGYILKQNGLLACENCTYFHRKENVKEYNILKEKGLNTREIFYFFIERIEKIDK